VQTEEKKAAPKPKPTYPKGLNKETFATHDTMHDIANDRGWDPETHFRASFSVLLP
jgi:GNAT superfamily N-acetyltransferase